MKQRMSLHRLFDDLAVDRFFSGLEDIASDLMETLEVISNQILIGVFFNFREVSVMYRICFAIIEMAPDFITGESQDR